MTYNTLELVFLKISSGYGDNFQNDHIFEIMQSIFAVMRCIILAK